MRALWNPIHFGPFVWVIGRYLSLLHKSDYIVKFAETARDSFSSVAGVKDGHTGQQSHINRFVQSWSARKHKSRSTRSKDEKSIRRNMVRTSLSFYFGRAAIHPPYLLLGLYQARAPSAASRHKDLSEFGGWLFMTAQICFFSHKFGGWLPKCVQSAARIVHIWATIKSLPPNSDQSLWWLAAEGALAW